MPYMAYAHWLLLYRILAGAGVEQVQVNTDIDSMSRAAFLSVFADEIKRGDAHAFFVNYTKWQTIDERERILKESQQKQAAFVATLPEAVREDSREVGRRMMKARIEERQKHGKWDDQWVVHPFPTLDEPHKAVCWLTRHEAVGRICICARACRESIAPSKRRGACSAHSSDRWEPQVLTTRSGTATRRTTRP